MRIVLDTNVFIISLGRASKFRPIFDAIKAGKIILLLTTEIYLEYLEQLEYKTTSLIALNICNSLSDLKNVEVINVSYRWNLIAADQDDNKFTDCAVAANADFLVTNDAHFKVLKIQEFPPINIISAEDFLQLLLHE